VKKTLIAVAVVGAVLGLVVFIWTGISAFSEQADAISDDVIARYVGFLQSGQYGEAYDSCLAETLKEATTRAEFVATHAAHTREYGDLTGWKQTTYDHEANLFSSESLVGVHGVLSYANRDVFVLYKVDAAAEPYRIQEILGSPDTRHSLSHGIW